MMQVYQLEVLDEKVMTILKGLEQLSIITLRPLTNDQEEESLSYSSKEQVAIIEEPKQPSWKSLKGSVTSPSAADVEKYLSDIRDDWE